MKKPARFLTTVGLFASLVFCGNAEAYWTIKMSDRLFQYGYWKFQYHGNYASEAACKQAIEKAVRESGDPSLAFNLTAVDMGGSSGGSSGGFSGVSTGGSFEVQMMKSMLEPLFSNLFSSLFAPAPDTSVQDEIARQKAIQKQKEEEQKRQAAVQAWIDLQKKEKLQKIVREAEEKERGKKLLATMGSTGGSGLAGGGRILPFKWDTPGVRYQPIGTGSYPTSGFKPMETLLGATSFFGNALDAADKEKNYEKARFFGEQADKVIQGQPTNVACEFASRPAVPEPPDPKRVEFATRKLADLVSTFQVEVKSLQASRSKLLDLKEEIRKAESKKQAAELKLQETRNAAVTAKPEEKIKADELAEMARAQLRDANEELAKVKESESGAVQEVEKHENNIKNMAQEIQAGRGL